LTSSEVDSSALVLGHAGEPVEEHRGEDVEDDVDPQEAKVAPSARGQCEFERAVAGGGFWMMMGDGRSDWTIALDHRLVNRWREGGKEGKRERGKKAGGRGNDEG
jgi:hypothetical protein